MGSIFDKLKRELQFKLSDTTLTSDINQTLSNLLSQSNKNKKNIATVSTVANTANIKSTFPSLALEGLSDVVITAVQNGQTITWNGVDWVNTSFNSALPPIFTGVWSVWGGDLTPITFGLCSSGFSNATGEGHSSVNPTATFCSGTNCFASNVANTSTLIGWKAAENGNNSLIPILAFNRLSFRFQLVDIGAGTRYWFGLCSHNIASGTGTNATAILNTTKLATDTPNSNLIGFRASGTTDANFQAVAVTAGGSQTTKDTGIPIDTAVHLFEIAPNANATALNFYIDGATVAQITTNIPSATPATAADGLASMFWTGDNKNTNTAISATYYSMLLSQKQ